MGCESGSNPVNLFSSFFDTLAPPVCIGCGRGLRSNIQPLCTQCRRELPWWRVVDGCPQVRDSAGDADPTMPADVESKERVRRLWPDVSAEGSALHAMCRALVRYEGPRSAMDSRLQDRSRNLVWPGRSQIRLAIDHLARRAGRSGRDPGTTNARPRSRRQASPFTPRRPPLNGASTMPIRLRVESRMDSARPLDPLCPRAAIHDTT